MATSDEAPLDVAYLSFEERVLINAGLLDAAADFVDASISCGGNHINHSLSGDDAFCPSHSEVVNNAWSVGRPF